MYREITNTHEGRNIYVFYGGNPSEELGSGSAQALLYYRIKKKLVVYGNLRMNLREANANRGAKSFKLTKKNVFSVSFDDSNS